MLLLKCIHRVASPRPSVETADWKPPCALPNILTSPQHILQSAAASAQTLCSGTAPASSVATIASDSVKNWREQSQLLAQPCFWPEQRQPLPAHALVHTLEEAKLASGKGCHYWLTGPCTNLGGVEAAAGRAYHCRHTCSFPHVENGRTSSVMDQISESPNRLYPRCVHGVAKNWT